MENCHKPYIWKHDVCKLFPEKKIAFMFYTTCISL